MPKLLRTIILTVVLVTAGALPSLAECNIADAKLEEAILKKPEFRDPKNRRLVQDLRRLRDAAFTLWTYGQSAGCEQLLGHIRELVAAPSMGSLGGSDEDEADQQVAALDPMVQKGGGAVGNRRNADAGPLTELLKMVPPMQADEIMGSEVRTADDMIVGEVRNIVIGGQGHGDYAVVATGGYFVPGKKSFAVPLNYLRVSRERNSLYLAVTKGDLSNVPLMPDDNYEWVTNATFLNENNSGLSGEPKQNK